MRFLNLLVLLMPRSCISWGTVGHEVIANVAWNLLTNDAQSWVQQILNVTSGNSTQSPLGDVADWADRVRHYLPWSASLHFIDVRDDLFGGGCHVAPHLNPGCRFEYDRDCVDDRCVAGAIVNYTNQLLETRIASDHRHALSLRGSSTIHPVRDDSLAKQALMFLIHFVGDIHQPLHCSRATDKGGNDFQVHFKTTSADKVRHRVGRSRSAGSHHHSWNLHSVWDTGLIDVALNRDYNNSQSTMEGALLREVHRREKRVFDYLDCSKALGTSRVCAIQWGQESWDAAIRFAYTLDDNITDVTDGATLDEGYYETRWPIAKERLLAGSVRLAATLERIAESDSTAAVQILNHGHTFDESATANGRSELASMLAWK